MSPTEPPSELSLTCDGDGVRLRVDFYRIGDRFHHRISSRDADGTIAGWSAVQDGELPEWPQSPPIQELTRHEEGDRAVLLGVGSAGRSHWSISIETVPGNRPALRFDIACRSPAQPGPLAATYKPDADTPPALMIECEENARRSTVDGLHRIKPHTLPDRRPATVRWSFLIRSAHRPDAV